MIAQFDRYMLKYVYDLELLLITKYNIDAFTMEQNMTMIDLQTFTQGLEFQIKEEKKQNDGNKMLKYLAALRDILNMMKLPENR